MPDGARVLFLPVSVVEVKHAFIADHQIHRILALGHSENVPRIEASGTIGTGKSHRLLDRGDDLPSHGRIDNVGVSEHRKAMKPHTLVRLSVLRPGIPAMVV